MEGGDHFETKPPRKVVTLRPRASPPPEKAGVIFAGPDTHKLWTRRQLWARWIDAFWVLLATVLAASRLFDAVQRREVFGLEASMAFLLVASIPLIRGRAFFSALRRVPGALRKWADDRRERKS
jgi:hypothetical protein